MGNEADSQKKRLEVEKLDLERQIEEGEAAMAALNKNKISLTTQLGDTERMADSEARDRSAMLTKYKHMSTELEAVKEKIDDEHQRKSDALKQLSKAQAEIQLWRSRYETEGLGRVDELEMARNKLQARIAEAEETVDSMQSKIANAEKSKSRMQADLEDISMEYERVHAAAIITEKRGRNFDKVISEWKSKADDVSAEVDASQKECRNFNSELFRLRAAHEETVEQLDVVKRENKNLADEIKDLLDQLGDGGRSIHELDKQRRPLEAEENKVLRAQLELGQVKQEIDRKIAEKEEEFENTRKNHARAMDSMQASLESEQRAKAEGLRIKKKLEGEINELEIALDGEMEEARSLLDSAERGKRQTEAELGEARNAVNEMSSINSRASGEKRSIEGAVHTLHAEIDDMLHQAKNSEEKAKKAMVDAARLADELRAEQDHTNTLSKTKRSLESQLGELENKCAEANDAAMRGGRAALAKLETRIRELEIELGNAQSHTAENMKGHQKTERRCKELQFQIDEDKKNQDRMAELASKLQQKIKTYKKQIEEAEEIAALNLAKFRKAQQELEETEERSKMAEGQMSLARGASVQF